MYYNIDNIKEPHFNMDDIYAVLEKLGIDYKKHQHEALFTCEQAEELYSHIEGGDSKNLFIRNKKGDQHYLCIVESHKKVDLPKLAQFLGEKKIGFASPERLKKYLNLTPGSVSPFGLIHDTDKHVKVVVDEDLMKHDVLHYHPNINTATLEIEKDDLLKFLEWSGQEVQYYTF